MYNKIFISHSSKNVDKAMEICKYLEADENMDIKSFFAPRDIPPTENYAECIMDALNDCEALLLILSKESNNSQHVLREVELAIERKMPIFIYRLDSVEFSKPLNYFLCVYQWIDTGENTEYATIMNALKTTEKVVPVVKPVDVLAKKKLALKIVCASLACLIVAAITLTAAFFYKKKELDRSETATEQELTTTAPQSMEGT